jgi:hypothetical protein
MPPVLKISYAASNIKSACTASNGNIIFPSSVLTNSPALSKVCTSVFSDFNHVREFFNSADYIPSYTVFDNRKGKG